MSKVEYVDYHLLVKARDLLETEENWVQRKFGRSPKNSHLVLLDTLEDAVAFCAVGALAKAAGVTGKKALELNAAQILSTAVPQKFNACGPSKIMTFNDDPATTYKKIINMFNRAIKKAAALAGISA